MLVEKFKVTMIEKLYYKLEVKLVPGMTVVLVNISKVSSVLKLMVF